MKDFDDLTAPCTSASASIDSVKCEAFASTREESEKLDTTWLLPPPPSELSPETETSPSRGGQCACEMGRHAVSIRSVSIILTAPSDDDASILTGTRLVIIEMMFPQ
mmetsp:Transcript_51608/g.109749  ORF Transcript_51608/g.109749 Transcript_51608/m.109749 type:complete len:107 (+) Transcript_51608:666-986(+)